MPLNKIKESMIEEVFVKKVNDHTALLADNVTRIDKTLNVYHTPKTITKKAYMTIVDDDARIEVLTKLKPISELKGVPITLAVPITYPYATPSPRQMTPTELLDLQNNLGWEMASHTHNHPDLRVLSDEAVKYQLEESKKELESWGLNIENIVYPFGSNEGGANSPFVKELSSKFYQCGTRVGGGTVNTKPVDSFSLYRVALGSFTEGTGTNTLEHYKARVDEAIANNGWLIFMTHCHHPDHTDIQNQYLSDVIDYALSQGVEIVNLRDGYKQMGNAIEVGGKFGVGFDGVMRDRSTSNNYKMVQNSSVDGVSLITDFEKGTVTYAEFNTSTKGTLPDAGTLVTFRPYQDVNYSYQHLYGYFNGNVFYRRWTNTTGWESWKKALSAKSYSITVDCGTINANTVKNISVASLFPAINNGETCIIQPDKTAILPGEIMFSNGGSRIFLYNTHTAALTVGNKLFHVTVL